jgi:hypothetical protein
VNNDARTNFNTVSEHEIFGDRDFPSWLTQQQISQRSTIDYQLFLLSAISKSREQIVTLNFPRLPRISGAKKNVHSFIGINIALPT